MIGARVSRNFCLQCTRTRAALNHANRVKWGLAKDEPKPTTAKPKEDLSHVWQWIVDNAPVRKCDLSRVMFGYNNNPEFALRKLESNGYLVSEHDGKIYAFERVE